MAGFSEESLDHGGRVRLQERQLQCTLGLEPTETDPEAISARHECRRIARSAGFHDALLRYEFRNPQGSDVSGGRTRSDRASQKSGSLAWARDQNLDPRLRRMP